MERHRELRSRQFRSAMSVSMLTYGIRRTRTRSSRELVAYRAQYVFEPHGRLVQRVVLWRLCVV